MSKQTKQLITLTLTPEQVADSLPVNFLGGADVSNGFEDKPFTLPFGEGTSINYEISFDGESELLATVLEKPDSVSEDQAENLLTTFFSDSDDDEDEDDDIDDEDEDEEDQ